MHARSLCFAATLFVSGLSALAHAEDDSETHIRAAYTASGDVAKLTVVNGGKKPSVKIDLKGKGKEIYGGEAVATIESGHGIVLIAVSIDAEKKPFQVVTLKDGKLSTPIGLPRPAKRENYPFAVAATATPDGFTIFFQEVETANPNEAHTYMVELDKTGAVTKEPAEVQIPWALAAAAWNGDGYHLGLFYTGGGGITLSMVSTTKDGSPQQHPDWATPAGMISDVHLVANGKSILAVYRGMGDRVYSTDVSKIGQWGQVSQKAKDLGALSASQTIAISAKGAVTKVKAK